MWLLNHSAKCLLQSLDYEMMLLLHFISWKFLIKICLQMQPLLILPNERKDLLSPLPVAAKGTTMPLRRRKGNENPARTRTDLATLAATSPMSVFPPGSSYFYSWRMACTLCLKKELSFQHDSDKSTWESLTGITLYGDSPLLSQAKPHATVQFHLCSVLFIPRL